jgi:DeoR/GlpR family transcriptional regulator of sugar metabolism
MYFEERKKIIIDVLQLQGACTYQELEKLLSVSNMTVRRDIDRLVNEKKVIKTLGGVQIGNVSENFYETNLLSRLHKNVKEKNAIAKTALGMIEPGETIYLDGSSTCIQLAKLLARKTSGITILTNSPLVHIELARGVGNTIICIGGQHDPTTFCLVGDLAENEARKYYIDKVFISTKGFLPAEGTFESSIATFRIKQIFAAQTKHVILLADYSKFGQRALRKVLNISEIDTVITDDKTPEQELALLRKNNVSVLVVASLEQEVFEEVK